MPEAEAAVIVAQWLFSREDRLASIAQFATNEEQASIFRELALKDQGHLREIGKQIRGDTDAGK